MFKFIMQHRNGTTVPLYYDQHSSRLWTESGMDVFPIPTNDKKWPTIKAISPDDPGTKQTNAFRRVKIQLGLGCNYSCSYCSQATHIEEAEKTAIAEAQTFLDNLDSWLVGVPQKIEFWGGEPLLYWKKIQILAPALRKKFPDVHLMMITNGSLLTREIVDDLIKWDITGAISHDGPGQFVRGPDPFDDPVAFDAIKYLMDKLGREDKYMFNAVLTPASYDILELQQWFWDKFGWEVPVSLEGVVHDYNGDEFSRFTAEQLKDLTEKTTKYIIEGKVLRVANLMYKVQTAIDNMAEHRPSSAVGQKCGMDRDDYIAVDLRGNIMTCQNVGPVGKHKVGHVSDLAAARVVSSKHWSHREECPTCPVLQLCQGACMYNEDDHWAAACNAEFAFNMAALAGALFFSTGMVLMRIEGTMIRPALPEKKPVSHKPVITFNKASHGKKLQANS